MHPFETEINGIIRVNHLQQNHKGTVVATNADVPIYLNDVVVYAPTVVVSITINEEEYHFLIREAWLGEDYICEYETKDGKTIRYDHDALFQRHKEKITANKSWINHKLREVHNGKGRRIPYRGEMVRFPIIQTL